MTDLRHDVSELLVEPPAAATRLSPRATNPYAAPMDRSAEPVRSDPYAALREDAEAREANEFALPSLSSLSSARTATEETERVVPPEPVLSEAVLVAAGLLEGPADETPTSSESAAPDDTAVMATAPAASVNEVTFSDFLHDGAEPAADQSDLTEVFAGLEPVEAPTGVWRRGDDDVIGAGTSPSRSVKRRSLRLRRKAA